MWGVLVVLAKLGSSRMVGQFALGLAVTTPIVMLSNLALRAVLATDAKQQFRFVDYLSLRFMTTTLALLAIAFITFLAGYGKQTALVVIGIGLAKAMESISDILYGLFQRYERMEIISKSMMMKGPLSLLILSLLLVLTGNILWSVLGWAGARFLVLAAYDFPYGKLMQHRHNGVKREGNRAESISSIDPRPYWKFRRIWNLLRFSLPLGLTAMLVSLNSNIPIYFIQNRLGEREVGFFAAMASLYAAGAMLINAMGQSASPRLANYYLDGKKRAFRRLLIKLIGMAVFIGVAGILAALAAGRQILTFLYRPEYATHVNVLVWLMVAAGISYVGNFLGYGVVATRAYGSLILPYFFVSAVCLAASMFLIPEYGLMGAAGVSCIVGLTTCAMALVIFVIIKGRS
jgi:O-antigen/teichoic acid export membrane protein